LSDEDFIAFPNPTPVTSPVNPLDLNIPAGTSQAQSIVLKDTNERNKKAFCEYTTIKQALKNQIIQAVEKNISNYCKIQQHIVLPKPFLKLSRI